MNFNDSICDRLVFDSDKIKSLVSLDITIRIFDFILVHIWNKSQLSFQNELEDIIEYNPIPLSSYKRLLITESILKELE